MSQRAQNARSPIFAHVEGQHLDTFDELRHDLQTLHGQLLHVEHEAEACGHDGEAGVAHRCTVALAGLLWGAA